MEEHHHQVQATLKPQCSGKRYAKHKLTPKQDLVGSLKSSCGLMGGNYGMRVKWTVKKSQGILQNPHTEIATTNLSQNSLEIATNYSVMQHKEIKR